MDRTARARGAAALICLFLAGGARAADEEIIVFGHAPVTAPSELVRGHEDFELRPIESPAQILEVVPGLITAQHAGGGKADQILIRGFDADHGTDMALSIDGVPVNMRSHAHGQGYADMHWLIPELVDRIDVAKGAYSPEVGDFVTAGAANLVLLDTLPESFASLEVGDWDTQRLVVGASPREARFAGEGADTAFLALEGYRSDGPFERDEKLTRANLFAGYGRQLSARSRLSGWLSYYRGEWDASGQIPLRFVRAGTIDRFGDLDQDEGGHSWRGNLALRLVHELGGGRTIEATGFLSRYSLDLYSNFTGFLADPERGDGIVQRDDRWLYGGSLRYRAPFLAADKGRFTLGLDVRADDARVELAQQEQRREFAPTSDDSIYEVSFGPFVSAEWFPLPWLRALGGLRAEQFRFSVHDQLGMGRPSGNDADWIALPKSSLVMSPFSADGPLASGNAALASTELYLSYGRGFHSNDARDVVANPRERTLPAANAWEVGLRTRLAENLQLAVGYWWLDLQQEMVYVGDEGVTEPSGRSSRQGVESVLRWDLTDWLDWQAELSYSSGRFDGGARISQAPRMVFATRLEARHPSGLSARLGLRSLGERYAVEEDTSLRLSGYSVVDLGASYRYGPFELRAIVENLFDRDWRSAEFLYTSRFAGEAAAGVDDFHFTPGNPRNLRVAATFRF